MSVNNLNYLWQIKYTQGISAMRIDIASEIYMELTPQVAIKIRKRSHLMSFM